ncbi:MAG TPA: sigma-70 family RNA polymerase sigma factor [Gemmataceae bacterium]|jgi:RNA polymerase sigma factor (sigma-70 family)
MGTHLREVIRHLRRLAAGGRPGDPADADLLDRFLGAGDPAAFELLLWRHGAMVYGVCRRVLRHEQDAEDAFQAAFLTLARKGRSVSRRGSVSGWLYTVAYRTALAAKARARKVPTAPLPDVPAPDGPADWWDVRPVIDSEIARLPERLRRPFVLCCLEGLTVDEAARRLGTPRGTVGTRVGRARDLLRERLAGRGIGLAAAALTSALAVEASAGVPAALVTGTLAIAAGTAPPSRILTLADGVARAMLMTQLKTAGVAAVAVIALGAGGLVMRTAAADGVPAPATPAPPADRVALGGWGTAADPDGDCKFAVGRGDLTIGVPGSDHVLGVERGRMNAPRVLREIEGDFVAQVRVAAEFPAGTKTLVPNKPPVIVAGLLLYVDDGNYVRLERADTSPEGGRDHYANWELRRNGEWVRAGGPADGALDRAEPMWLRLERRGARLLGYYSADAITWTSLVPLDVTLPKKVRIGVSAGHNTTTPFAATFAGWQLFQCVASTPPPPPKPIVRQTFLNILLPDISRPAPPRE